MAVESFLMNNSGIVGLLSFLFGMFFAEETIFTLTILSVRNLITIKNILFALLGVIFCNLLMYFLGRIGAFKFIKRFKTIALFLKKSEAKANRHSKGKIEKSLFFSKFVMGGRLILGAFLGHRKIKFSKFLFNMLFVEILWAMIAIGFGLFFNESYEFFSRIIKGIALISFSLISLFFGVYYTKHKIKQKALNNTVHNIIVENGHSTKERSNGFVSSLDTRETGLLRI